MSDDFKLVQESSCARVFVRSWVPGDGLVCTFSKAAPRELPCGAPVAVVMTEDPRSVSQSGRFSRAATRRIACRNHAPGIARPHEINSEAKRVAAEQLIVEHWDLYQQYLEEATSAAQEKALEFADPEIRRIVLGEDGAA